MVDKPLVQRKITLLQEKKKEIEGYEIKDLKDFKAKGYMQKAVEKMLQEMIEICLDIGKHIIADEGFRLPEDAKDTFAVLLEKAVLTESTAALMKKMVGFRNIVVHLYEKTDVEIVYGIYQKHLSDFNLFSKEILGYLKKTVA